ncbi:MAG: ATP-binding protein [Pseudomonadota bacterium]
MAFRTLIQRAHGAQAVLGLASLCALALAAAPNEIRADAGPTASVDAGADAGAASPDARTAEIRELVNGSLAVTVDPQTLFDVSLSDEKAVQVEAARLRTLLEPAKPQSSADISKRRSQAAGSAKDAGLDTVDPDAWRARVDLDKARFDFYVLPRERRSQLLREHAQKQEAAQPKETAEDRRAREVEQERQTALAAAREARSEAERLVAQELARLIGVERTVQEVRNRLTAERATFAARGDALLGWQHRVREAEAGSAELSDTTYDAVRKTLRASRDELSATLNAAGSASSDVPDLGPDALTDIPSEVPTDEVRARRAAVERSILAARSEERAIRGQRAATLLGEIDKLNQDRLDLLPHLSSDKRAAITGFTVAGLDQARAEGRQLLLILRYHRHVADSWLRELRARQFRGIAWWSVTVTAVPWLIGLLLFFWWRRRSPQLFALAEKRIADDDRSARRNKPSALYRAVRLVRGFHRPLEWLLFLGFSIRLLPQGAENLLETQLLVVVVGWTLGGALIVNVLNAIATLGDAPKGGAQSEIAQLRLRSLRLVGRVVVAFALVLVLSERLVGNGTVHSWVWSTCWFAAVPVFLILVRWWRQTVFERVERVRRKSALQAWLLANRVGWKSFFAAMIAAVQLFVLGSYKVVRTWVAGFDLARRAHAYLFKRELARLAEARPEEKFRPLRADAAASLAPNRMGDAWLGCPAEAHSRTLSASAAERHGGLVAVVAPRGLGKSTLLRHVARLVPGTATLSCQPHSTVQDLQALLEKAAPAPVGEGGSNAPSLLLIDDAQALMKPILGGLRVFDEALSFARSHSQHSLWVFAIDATLWPFLQRARDSRPLFDRVIKLEPWRDEQIDQLLTLRSREAGIDPSFEDLLEPLPHAADEIDQQEALESKRVGYSRMVWDYARGNPGLALEVWRNSVAESVSGSVRVRPLTTPDADVLELLPDSTLFILRAVLQMAPVSVSDVALATRIGEAQVQSAFRFGGAHGYLEEDAGRVTVAWRWLRAITALLERRHLLVDA